MRVGVISDIHANRVALQAVLDDLPEVDALVCAGDVVGYLPWPGECVDRLRELAVPTVMGNHDRMVVSGRNFRGNQMARAGIEYASDVLTADQRDWLADLPTEQQLVDGGVRIVHGHPDDPDRYTHPRDFGPGLLGDESVLIMGHTHVQYHEVYPDGVVMNPGSVGQPRDGDPRAAYALLDLDDDDGPVVTERRVEYAVQSVADAVRDAGLPRRSAARLFDGR